MACYKRNVKASVKTNPSLLQKIWHHSSIQYVYCCRGRISTGQAVGIDGQPPKYDKLDRGLSSYNALHHQNSICSLDVPQGIATTETLREHNYRSIDWSELREFTRASESDVYSKGVTEMGVAEQSTSFHRRRFSVDLGEVREFIALREMRIHFEDECTVWAVKKCVWDKN